MAKKRPRTKPSRRKPAPPPADASLVAKRVAAIGDDQLNVLASVRLALEEIARVPAGNERRQWLQAAEKKCDQRADELFAAHRDSAAVQVVHCGAKFTEYETRLQEARFNYAMKALDVFRDIQLGRLQSEAGKTPEGHMSESQMLAIHDLVPAIADQVRDQIKRG